MTVGYLLAFRFSFLRLFYCVSVLLISHRGPLLVHNMCLVRPALLYRNVHVLKVFYEQMNYYYYYYYYCYF